METLVRYVGCLLGVAIGDALGYPVEFQRHGPFIVSGMTSPWYSDDTQMTLATTEGLIKSKETGNPTAEVYREYLRWLDSQSDPSQRRAPGGTCISALSSGQMGTVENKLNDSKGCGGVMRTAPAGLACLPNAAFRYGVEFAAITHSHPSGYLSAGFLSELISRLSLEQSLSESIDGARATLVGYEGHEETLENVDQARGLALEKASAERAIAMIGGGWVGEEALGIAVFCALRFCDNWKAGVLAAVNHGGDSDSTGSIAGAILGTLLGVQAIPINCPSCGKRLNVPRQGKFACPVCRVGMSLDRKGKVALV